MDHMAPWRLDYALSCSPGQEHCRGCEYVCMDTVFIALLRPSHFVFVCACLCAVFVPVSVYECVCCIHTSCMSCVSVLTEINCSG